MPQVLLALNFKMFSNFYRALMEQACNIYYFLTSVRSTIEKD